MTQRRTLAGSQADRLFDALEQAGRPMSSRELSDRTGVPYRYVPTYFAIHVAARRIERVREPGEPVRYRIMRGPR